MYTTFLHFFLRFSTGHDRATWQDPTVAADGGL